MEYVNSNKGNISAAPDIGSLFPFKCDKEKLGGVTYYDILKFVSMEHIYLYRRDSRRDF